MYKVREFHKQIFECRVEGLSKLGLVKQSDFLMTDY